MLNRYIYQSMKILRFNWANICSFSSFFKEKYITKKVLHGLLFNIKFIHPQWDNIQLRFASMIIISFGWINFDTQRKSMEYLLKVNESRYKQRGVTQHFSTGQNLLKKILRKNKYWHNQLRKVFWLIRWTQIT